MENQEKVNPAIIDETKVNSIRTQLESHNELITPYKLAYVNPVEDCVLLQKNARYMDKAVLDKLVSNIAEDGFLSQLPFSMKRTEDSKYLILSGNHRIKAAIKAKLEYVLIMYIDEVSKDRQIAYQLSHNSLVGKDDVQMLKDIFEEIKSIENKKYSGINDLHFIDIEKLNITTITDADIELTEMKFLFIESRAKDVQKILAILEKQKIDSNTALVVGKFEEFVKTMTAVKKVYNIKSNTVAFSKMIDICNEVVKAAKN